MYRSFLLLVFILTFNYKLNCNQYKSSSYLYHCNIAPVIRHPPGIWKDILPKTFCSSPLSGWKADSYSCFAFTTSSIVVPTGSLPALKRDRHYQLVLTLRLNNLSADNIDIFYVIILYVQSTVHQTIHFGIYTFLI
jgi:hypothetical protein